MDRINEYIETQLDFEFEFEIDIFYLKRIKKWIKHVNNKKEMAGLGPGNRMGGWYGLACHVPGESTTVRQKPEGHGTEDPWPAGHGESRGSRGVAGVGGRSG